MKTERPQAVTNLLKEAEKRNLSLLSARLSQDLAREQIKSAETGYMPTIGLTASTSVTNTRYSGGTPSIQQKNNDSGQNQIGVQLSLPLYSGGATNSSVKQAQYNFVGASEQLESAHRGVVQTVRSSFNNISASISSIKAYEQVVVSNQSSLDAMEAGYQVGTRTILDVLTATTNLYQSKQQLADARYNYLINQLNIKSALGTLNMNDLIALNGVLDKPVPTSATSLAPDNADQNAYANGTQAAPRATTVSQSTATAPAAARNGNPFRN